MNKLEYFDLTMDLCGLLFLGGDRRRFSTSNDALDKALSMSQGNLTPDLDTKLTFSNVKGRIACDQLDRIIEAAVELDIVSNFPEPCEFEIKLSTQSARMNAVRSGMSTEDFILRGSRLVGMVDEEERYLQA